MRRILPDATEIQPAAAVSFKSGPSAVAPRRSAGRQPRVLCEAKQQSAITGDALDQSDALSLVRQPTVDVTKAFTTHVQGARRDVRINNVEPSMRHIVVHDKPVGEGGQSVVFAATNAVTGASLVYKQLRATNMQAALLEALQEANIAREMDSPMAPIVVQQNDKVALVAQAMPTDLLQSARTAHKASWSQMRTLALDALFDVAADLHTLHNKGYLHCDVKADNVLMAENRQWKLGDFGHATRARDITGSKHARGTMAFWAPEVFDGEPFSEKSDIYSLGLLYLTVLNRGTPPMFTADPFDHYVDAGEWEHFIDQGHEDPANSAWMRDRPALARIYEHLNPAERTLVRAILHSDPNKRPTAEALLAMRRKLPGLKRKYSIVKRALDALPSIGAFRAKHNDRMREVLKPAELERRSSYGSSESGSETPSPRATAEKSKP